MKDESNNDRTGHDAKLGNNKNAGSTRNTRSTAGVDDTSISTGLERSNVRPTTASTATRTSTAIVPKTTSNHDGTMDSSTSNGTTTTNWILPSSHWVDRASRATSEIDISQDDEDTNNNEIQRRQRSLDDSVVNRLRSRKRPKPSTTHWHAPSFHDVKQEQRQRRSTRIRDSINNRLHHSSSPSMEERDRAARRVSRDSTFPIINKNNKRRNISSKRPSPTRRRLTQQQLKKNANSSSNSSMTTVSTTKQLPKPYRKRKKVIVIGAGMSGLACARELTERGGWDVLVVERRGRVGGRLCSVAMHLGANHHDSSSTTTINIDVGGALIHGTEDNPLTELCQELNIPLSRDLSSTLLLDAAGWPLDVKEDKTAYQQFNECLDVAFDRVHRHTTNTNHDDQEEEDSKPGAEASGGHEAERSGTNNSTPTQSASSRNKQFHTNSTCIIESPRPDSTARPSGASGNSNDASHHGSLRSHDGDDDNLGLLMERIRSEQAHGPANGILSKSVTNGAYQWHKRSLELSCGTVLEDLSAKHWNDDEAYGYQGGHVGLSQGHAWQQSVCEAIANPLEILHHAAVKEIRVIEAGEEVVREDKGAHGNMQVDDPSSRNGVIAATRQSRRLRGRVSDRIQEEEDNDATAMPTSPSVASSMGSALNAEVNGETNRRRVSARSNKGVAEPRWEAGIDELYRKFGSMSDPNAFDMSSSSFNKARTEGTAAANQVQSKYRSTNQPRVWVTLQDGRVLEADAVVCTLPLGVLQHKELGEEAVKFVPPLPASQRDALSSLGSGLLNKVVLTFERVFWQDVDFLGYCEATNPYIVLNGHAVTEKPVLIIMLAGSQAREVEQSKEGRRRRQRQRPDSSGNSGETEKETGNHSKGLWSDEALVEDILEMLAYVCQLPIGTILTPLDVSITRWGHDPAARMSFSYVPPHVDGPAAYHAVSRPILSKSRRNLPLVLFAGEHTTPFHPSTIHGAYLSGIREAYRLDMTHDRLANSHLGDFNESHLYQRTFTLRQRKGAGVSPPFAELLPMAQLKPLSRSTNNLITPRGRHRLRQSGHMQLRQRSNTMEYDEATTTSLSDDVEDRLKTEIRDSTAAKATRKSQRMLWRENMNRNSDISATNAPSSLKPAPGSPLPTSQFDRSAFIERALQRCLDAYGPNWNMIESIILPLWDVPPKDSKSFRRKSIQQVYKRLRIRQAANIKKQRQRDTEKISLWLAPLQVGNDFAALQPEMK